MSAVEKSKKTAVVFSEATSAWAKELNFQLKKCTKEVRGLVWHCQVGGVKFIGLPKEQSLAFIDDH